MHATVGALLLAVTVPAATARAGTAAPAADPVKVLATIPFGGSGPLAIAVSPLTDEAYVIEVSQVGTVDRQTVVVISGKTNKVITSIPGNFYVGGPASISPKTGDIYAPVAEASDNAYTTGVAVLNGTTSKLIGTIKFPAGGIGPGPATVNPVTGAIYIPYTNDDLVTNEEVFGATNKLTGSIDVDGPVASVAAISPKTGDVYVMTGSAADAIVAVIAG